MNMRFSAGAALIAVAVAAIGTPVRAEMGASVSAPIRAGIDAYCRGASNAKVGGYFRSVQFEGRAARPWQRTTRSANAAVQNAPGFLSGQFALVRMLSGKVVSAEISSSDATGDGSTDTSYCFMDGRLVRIVDQLDSATYDTEWVNTRYFADDGSLMTSTTRSRPLARRVGAAPKVALHPSAVYRAPRELPFGRLIPH